MLQIPFHRYDPPTWARAAAAPRLVRWGAPFLVAVALAWLATLAGRGLVLLLVAPVIEEVVFRRGLHEQLLRRFNGSPAGVAVFLPNGLTALVFAAAHGAVSPGAASWLTLLPALLIGCIYQRGRRLLPCIAAHSLFNAGWLVWLAIQ